MYAYVTWKVFTLLLQINIGTILQLYIAIAIAMNKQAQNYRAIISINKWHSSFGFGIGLVGIPVLVKLYSTLSYMIIVSVG